MCVHLVNSDILVITEPHIKKDLSGSINPQLDNS